MKAISTGATVDKATADTSVATPLCLAVAQLALVTSPSVYGLRPDGTSMEAVELIRQASRLKSVIRILVEQHADVRRTMDGQPLIDLVCRSRAWDMITLFLEHGAAPPENLTALFPTASDRAKFTSIPVPKSTGRPARPCPCWSGRIVDECHAKQAQPYPSRYMCVCGSGKAYEKCCLARGSHVLQKWDPTLQRIMSEYEPIPYVTQINIHPGGGQEFGERLKALGIVDPAFSYACTRSQFVPTPLSRTGSRYVAESRQKEWNAFVDEYIDTQGDQRSREDIERAAKIGTLGRSPRSNLRGSRAAPRSKESTDL
ncbi:hypothetical protein B0H11DRAFT_1183000 [Mycena galericulata]|nr:hypothetical protein B0H11DRAFT_1183000 [Mycena galericulata]